MLYSQGFGVGVESQSPHMGLVNHAVAQGQIERPVSPPVEIIADHDTLGHTGDIRGFGKGEVLVR